VGQPGSEVAAFHIARQAIVDEEMRVNAYELFFRTISEKRSPFDPKNGDFASAMVMLGGFVDNGENDILANKPAFVNISQALAESGLVMGMCRKDIIFEVTAQEFSDKLLVALQHMAREGYRFALDRFVLDRFRSSNHQQVRILESCKYVKYDMQNHVDGDASLLIRAISEYENVQTIATYVETKADFESAKGLGCSYFQGYFFVGRLLFSALRLSAQNLESCVPFRKRFVPMLRLRNWQKLSGPMPP